MGIRILFINVREWSLITGRGGGYKTGGGGAREVLPLRKGGGAEKVLAILFWGSFYVIAGSFSHIVGGGVKFPLFKRGGTKSFTLS